MRRVGLVAMIGLIGLLQLSFWPALRPFGVVPSMAIGCMVAVGVFAPTSFGIAVAVAMGLVLDLSGGAGWGLWTGVLTMTVMIAVMLRRWGVEMRGLAIPAAVVVVATILAAFGSAVNMLVQGVRLPWEWMVGHGVVEMLCNVLLLWPIWALVEWVAKDKERLWGRGWYE